MCLSLSIVAQEHLSFKGIPITGSITNFCKQLRVKGFSQIAKEENIRIFKGDFTGQPASVGVIAADNGKDVFSVVVIFDESDSWNTLVNTYTHYKDLYIEKYGQPIQCVENNPSSYDSNTSLMYELLQGRVTYISLFEVKGGTIEISIEKGNIIDGYVVIRYKDAQNTNAKRQKDLEDI